MRNNNPGCMQVLFMQPGFVIVFCRVSVLCQLAVVAVL